MIQMENGYHLYDFRGLPLREEPVEQLKQFFWRPRPDRLLSKDEQKQIRRNLREYGRLFDEADMAKKNTANKEIVDKRRRQLEEWNAWRARTVEMLSEERKELGLEEKSEEETAALQDEGREGTKVVEEIIEEIIDETEEVVPA